MQQQTLKQLSVKYSKSISWIVKQRDSYTVDYKAHNPRPVNLICDATFYGKRKDKLGTLVFKDSESKEMLIWKHIEGETIQDYKYLYPQGAPRKKNFLDSDIASKVQL